jgi:hypothetical protein
VRITHFSSWLYVDFPSDVPFSGLFYAMMRDRGVHIWEGRCWFLTTAHTDADLDFVFRAFVDTISEMQAADLLPAACLRRSPELDEAAMPKVGRPGSCPIPRDPGSTSRSRRSAHTMDDARPRLRPVDFDPFAALSDSAVSLP